MWSVWVCGMYGCIEDGYVVGRMENWEDRYGYGCSMDAN